MVLSVEGLMRRGFSNCSASERAGLKANLACRLRVVQAVAPAISWQPGYNFASLSGP
jgi:hypothetical protein